jgi:hypothetical protein
MNEKNIFDSSRSAPGSPRCFTEEIRKVIDEETTREALAKKNERLRPCSQDESPVGQTKEEK